VTAITVVHVSFSASSPSRYNGSIGSGSLFLTLPTRLSTGHIVIASGASPKTATGSSDFVDLALERQRV
jgi:hypothetical protein